MHPCDPPSVFDLDTFAPDRITVNVGRIQYVFLASTPARDAAESVTKCLAALLSLVEHEHDMKDDQNVPSVVHAARKALASAKAGREAHEVIKHQHQLAPRLVQELRQILLCLEIAGEVPDEVRMSAAQLLTEACEPAHR